MIRKIFHCFAWLRVSLSKIAKACRPAHFAFSSLSLSNEKGRLAVLTFHCFVHKTITHHGH